MPTLSIRAAISSRRWDGARKPSPTFASALAKDPSIKDSMAALKRLGVSPVSAEPLLSASDMVDWPRALSRVAANVEKVMRAIARCLAAFSILLLMVLGMAAAQPADQVAAHKRYKEAVAAGNYRAALGEAVQLEQLAEPFANAQPGYYADVLVLLGEAHLALGYYLEAEGNFKSALTIRERTPGQAPADIAWTMCLLGETYRRVGRNLEAEPLLRRALEIWQRAPGDHRISVAWTFNGLGTIAYDAGRYAEAEALYEHAISISEENNNKATYLNNLATAYLKQDRDQEAEEHLNIALAIQEKSLGLDSPGHRPDAQQPGGGPSKARTAIGGGSAFQARARYGAEGIRRRPSNCCLHPDRPGQYVQPADESLRRCRATVSAGHLPSGRMCSGTTTWKLQAVLRDLAGLKLAIGDVPAALDFSRRAVDIVSQKIGKGILSSSESNASLVRRYFDQRLEILDRASGTVSVGTRSARGKLCADAVGEPLHCRGGGHTDGGSIRCRHGRTCRRGASAAGRFLGTAISRQEPVCRTGQLGGSARSEEGRRSATQDIRTGRAAREAQYEAGGRVPPVSGTRSAEGRHLSKRRKSCWAPMRLCSSITSPTRQFTHSP